MRNNSQNVVKIGIMRLDQFKKRTIAIAQGKYKASRNDPKIWFQSMRSLANVLSEENQALLRMIVDMQPKSISELEGPTGRSANNLLRTLRMLENYGFVKLRQGVSHRGRAPLIPDVVYSAAEIQVVFLSSGR